MTTISVLKWLAACALRLPKEAMVRCLPPVTRLLHGRVNEASGGGRGKGAPSAEVKGLAGEAVELLQSALGTDLVLGALNGERKRLAELRQKRAADRAILKVTAPAEAAAERIRRNAQKAQAKKRKVASFRDVKKGRK